jgi:hypothetical protein
MWLRGTYEPSIFVAMKSGDIESILSGILFGTIKISKGAFPVGFAQYGIIILMIVKGVFDGKAKRYRAAVAGSGEPTGEGAEAAATAKTKPRSFLAQCVIRAIPLMVVVFVLNFVALTWENAVLIFIVHALCISFAVLAAQKIDLRSGLAVCVSYAVMYLVFGQGYQYCFLFDLAYLQLVVFVAGRYQAFKVRIGIFAGMGFLYGALGFAIRGARSRHTFDGGSAILTFIYYTALSACVYLFLDFAWGKIEPKLPAKIAGIFTKLTKPQQGGDA